MTTVAYRNGVVAGDSRVTATDGSIYSEDQPKFVVSKKHGVIYLFAGDLAGAQAVIRALERLPQMPWLSDVEAPLPDDVDFELLTITRDGLIYSFDGPHWYKVNAEFVAIGSGGVGATAAMHMGAESTRAVEVAMLVDSSSGGPIHTFRLIDIPKPRRPRKKSQ
jgi:ATP-dependent protease HslVU (ClpYQ) peptidase subunit